MPREGSAADGSRAQLRRVADRLPSPFREELSELLRDSGGEELRFRCGQPMLMRCRGRWRRGMTRLTAELLGEMLTQFCQGALYAHRDTLVEGYVTLTDGCRVGVCGRAVTEDGRVVGVRDVRSLCVRLPAPIPQSVREAAERIMPLLEEDGNCRSVLLCGPPGAGKTTLLRAMAEGLSRPPNPRQTVVVDSRCELTPMLVPAEGCLDILTAYPRSIGIEIALRTMAAEVILCDEIGSAEDAAAILGAQACGVPIIATVHGERWDTLSRRPMLAPLFKTDTFGVCVELLRRPGESGFAMEIIRLWEP